MILVVLVVLSSLDSVFVLVVSTGFVDFFKALFSGFYGFGVFCLVLC